MIDREGIVRMALQYLIEFLDRAVVIEIVKVVEGRSVQRVVGTKRQAVPGVRQPGGSSGQRLRGSAPAPGREAGRAACGETNGQSFTLVLCLEFI